MTITATLHLRDCWPKEFPCYFWPDHGGDNWAFWLDEAWAIMVNSGLTTVHDSIQETVVRLRLLSLWWFAHEFSNALSYFDDGGPDWEEWMTLYEVNLELAISACEREKIKVPKNVAQDTIMVAVYFAFDQRSLILDTIESRLGDISCAFAKMYGATRNLSIFEDRLFQQYVDDDEWCRISRRTRQRMSYELACNDVLECWPDSEAEAAFTWYECDRYTANLRGSPEFPCDSDDSDHLDDSDDDEY